MNPSDIIAGAALVVSIVSAGFTAWVVFRDRARLRAQSRIVRYGEREVKGLEVEAVNLGRRRIVLTQFERLYDIGWVGTILGEKGRGIPLAEQERHEERLRPYEHVDEDGPHEEIDLAFRDTTGRRHRVRNARRDLRYLYAPESGNGK